MTDVFDEGSFFMVEERITPADEDEAGWDADSDAPAVGSSCVSSGSSGTRGFHTSAIARASEVPIDLLGAPAPPPLVQAKKQQAKAQVTPREENEEDLMEEEVGGEMWQSEKHSSWFADFSYFIVNLIF